MADANRIGRYEVLEHLAAGGMGSVYLAKAIGLAGFERHVVLKRLDRIRDDDDEALAMFLDEARVVARIHHQHIAAAHQLDCDDDGHYFLVLDYVHGQSAKAVWMRTRELGLPLPTGFTITAVAAAASALHYAHGLEAEDGTPLRIIHRDVSLSNLMIGYDGAIKLIDFGIAHAARRVALTRAGTMKGKVSYVAPEQITGRAIDHRADVFSLGIVLYELATMRRAFKQATDLETLERIARGQIVRPTRIVDGFPRELEEIILTALQVDPAKRFQDAEIMRRALEAYARRHDIALGDTPVVTVMEVLFDDRSEPWRGRATSELAPPVEDAVPQPSDDVATVPLNAPVPVRSPIRRAGVELEEARDVATTPFDLPTTPRATPVEPQAYPVGTGPEAALPPHRRYVWWIAPPAVTVIALVALCTRSPEIADAVQPDIVVAPRPAPVPVVTPLPQVEPDPPAPQMIRIHITTTPSDATVLLDGHWLGHTPFDGIVPAADGPHAIKIRRHGCTPQRLDVELRSDITRDLVVVCTAP
jgi:serine/threonine protein kinase